VTLFPAVLLVAAAPSALCNPVTAFLEMGSFVTMMMGLTGSFDGERLAMPSIASIESMSNTGAVGINGT